jgi:hypothetical protein
MHRFHCAPAIGLLVTFLVACKSSSNDAAPTGAGGGGGSDASVQSGQTSISGYVNDETGAPLAGVEATAGGVRATSDANGVFTLIGATASGDRTFVTCTKSGYFNGVKAMVPVIGGVTTVKLTMMSLGTATAIDAASGGTVSTDDGATITLPAGGFAKQGAPYSGSVNVSARHLSPDNAAFGSMFSGDWTGLDSNGGEAMLVSFGVLRVELRDDTGAPLNLAAGTTASLTYPIAASQAASPPATMPLWFFDDGRGIWQQEGTATLQSGAYVGSVSHFSAWNADDAKNRAYVKGRVVCGQGRRI